MKRSLVFSFFFCLALGAFAQKTYLVTGNFKCPYDGLLYLVHGDEKDSTIVKNGAFSFKGKAGLPAFSYVYFKNKTTVTLDPFYLGDGDVVIELDTVTKSGLRKSGKFSYISMQTKFLKKGLTDKLIDSVSSIISERTKTVVDQVAKNSEIKKIVLDFLTSQANTMASTVILKRNLVSFTHVELKQIYQSLSAEIKDTSEGKDILGATINVVRIVLGEKIPDFAQNDIKGEKISIQSLRGKYILIDFWASWCIPCRKENPVVVAAYQKFKDKGFEILSVSLDDKKQNWLKAIKDDKLSWLHVSDLNGWNNEVAKMFSIRSIPDNILIDKDGVILARGLTGVTLEEKLNEIFSKVK